MQRASGEYWLFCRLSKCWHISLYTIKNKLLNQKLLKMNCTKPQIFPKYTIIYQGCLSFWIILSPKEISTLCLILFTLAQNAIKFHTKICCEFPCVSTKMVKNHHVEVLKGKKNTHYNIKQRNVNKKQDINSREIKKNFTGL